ncbi:MAG: beta-propeller fold lactonase family protein [Leptospirales bacterium]|nr:beta-propeller fold lactonase family protein [Leptospirales bacterium]
MGRSLRYPGLRIFTLTLAFFFSCFNGRTDSNPELALLFIRSSSLVPRFVFVSNRQVASLSAFSIDPASGMLSQVSGSPFAIGPASGGSACQPVVDLSGRYVYNANAPGGSIYGFSIDVASRTISSIPGMPVTGLNQTLPVAIDSRSRYVFASENNSGGFLKEFTIGSNGGLTQIGSVNGGTQPSYPIVDTFDRFVFVGDFSGTNSAYPYKIDPSTGGLTVGANPTYNAVSSLPAIEPSGRLLFMQNTAGGVNGALLYSFLIDQNSGGLAFVDQDLMTGGPQGIGLPATTPNPPAPVVTPDGRFLYVSLTQNGNNGVAGYSIDYSSGRLTAIPGHPFATTGDTVQQPAIHPSGRFMYVANSSSSTIDAFAINSSTGALSAIAGSPFSAGTGPGPVVIDRGGYFAFVPNNNSGAGNTVSVFRIDSDSGVLRQVNGSPFTAGTGPLGIAVASYTE